MAADISVGIGVLGEKEFKKALDECQNSLKQLDFKVLGRVLGFIDGKSRAMFIGVLLCQIINALVMVKVSTFIGTMIDDHITPMLAAGSMDFAPLLSKEASH